MPSRGCEFTASDLQCRLKGHTASVCCLAVPKESDIIISGAEDGSICSFDVRQESLISRIQVADKDAAVPSVLADPSNANLLYCCTGSDIQSLDRRKDQAGCMWRQSFNADEVNALAFSSDGRLLASADDSGQVAMIDPASRALVRTLKKGHTSIASSVVFQGQNSWQAVSGGLDCQIIRWDVSGGKPLQRWQTGSEEGQTRSAQVFNPPMVHALASPTAYDDSTDGLVAAARGDGVVAVYDTGGSQGSAKLRKKGRQINPQVSAPVFAEQSHAAAVTCICFPAFGGGRIVMSGGNDGKIVLQAWDKNLDHSSRYRSTSKENPALAMDLRVLHGRKINFIAIGERMPDQIYVADVSKRISIYNLR